MTGPGVTHPPTAEERPHGIALCLSGGGFRAALFHLGALRRLHETGILAQVDTISSVSGGSIVAALLADLAVQKKWRNGLAITDFEQEVADPLRRLTRRDLRTLPFLVHLPWNWLLPQFRARHMERRYRNRVTRIRLKELPPKPLFIFCSTDMSFGVGWEASIQETGSYQAGDLTTAPEWPVARAVAASACFPPIFGPLPVAARASEFKGGDYRGSDGDRLREKLGLSDGGVYDNMGLEPVWKSHRWVLVSDCGAPFEFAVGKSPLRRLLRYTSVIMNQAQSLRKRMLVGDFIDNKYQGTYWSIKDHNRGTELGYSEDLVRRRIAEVRTDLDAFTEAEQKILENHGYAQSSQRLDLYAKQLMTPAAAPPRMPHSEHLDEQWVDRALRHSHKRVSLARLLGRA